MNNPQRANAVATTIGTIKWVLIGLIILGALITFIAGIASGGGDGVAVGIAGIIGGAIYALIAWVFFGWLEHTLKMLVNISNNTGGQQVTSYAQPAGAPPAPPTAPPGY